MDEPLIVHGDASDDRNLFFEIGDSGGGGEVHCV